MSSSGGGGKQMPGHGEEEHENEERWLLTYADLITLLMAFFVIMYAMSSADSAKFAQLAVSLSDAFHVPRTSPVALGGVGGRKGTQLAKDVKSNPPPVPGAKTAQEGEGESEQGGGGGTGPGEGEAEGSSQKGGDLGQESGGNALGDTGEKEGGSKGGAEGQEAEGYPKGASIKKVAEQFQALAVEAGLGNAVTVSMSPSGRKLVLKMSDAVLFDTGSAQMTAPAEELMAKIAEILKKANKTVQVEGHTDDVPINTPQYRSNWELSTARATNVIAQIVNKTGMDPTRFSASGYGEFHPLAPNDSPENRAKNRRVEFVITDTTETPEEDKPVPLPPLPPNPEPAAATPPPPQPAPTPSLLEQQ